MTAKTRASLKSDADTYIPDNMNGEVSPADIRDRMKDTADSAVFPEDLPGASAKTTPVDADTLPLNDSAASNVLKKVTWANIKATLKSYFDSLYAATGRGLPSGGTTGQVLVKTSGTNYAVGWDDQSGGGGGVSPPTSSTLPVGVWATIYNTDAFGSWSDNTTKAGAVLAVPYWDGTKWIAGALQSGTWRNISGASIPIDFIGLGVREA